VRVVLSCGGVSGLTRLIEELSVLFRLRFLLLIASLNDPSVGILTP